jgi:acyl-CoA synthetase (AMP-forming)/AMP-acid ligase II
MGLSRLRSRVAAAAQVPLVLSRSGLLLPGSPKATARQLSALARWGTGLAGTSISAAARDPRRAALIDDGGVLSYADLDVRTNRLAHGLGGRPKVALLCRNHRGLVESLIACSKLGADTVLLNTRLATAQQVSVLSEERVDVLIADAEFEELLLAAPGPLRKLISDDLPYAKNEHDLSPVRSGRTTMFGAHGAEDPSLGVRQFVSALSRLPLKVHERTLIESPLSHVWGHAGLRLALGLRSTIVLNPRYDPATALATIERHGCTSMFAAPVMLERILGLDVVDDYDTSTLRVAAVSGGTLPDGLATGFMNVFGEVLYSVYGSALTVATPQELLDRPDTAGKATAGSRLAILREDGSRALPGMPGMVFAGEGCVGDTGHVDAQGRLFLEGRPDEMVISAGENVFPAEVEDAIAHHPEVREVAVVGVPDPERGQHLAAYVVVRPEAQVNGDTVRDWVQRQFARFAVPQDVHFLDALPRNRSGKISRRALPGLA